MKATGGVLKALFAGTRAVDLMNLVVLLAPLVVLAIPIAVAFGKRLPRAREAVFLAVLAIPPALALSFVHPIQGLFRDWDVFAMVGVALTMLGAWFVAETLRGARRHAWLAVTVTVVMTALAVQWLSHQRDVDRGIARAEAFVSEPPQRSSNDRVYTLDYLGTRNNLLERNPASAAAFRRAGALAPSPRMLQSWAMSETMAGNLDGAFDVYQRQLATDSLNTSAWLGYSSVAWQIRRFDESRRALRKIIAIKGGSDAEAEGLLRAVEAEEAKQRVARDSIAR